uniref:Peptidyl-prolyl cis-trans isomerase n=1 Tax=Ditylenchus dipsaci TaxID=166011 RepID=A0A915DVU2_9BILA
MSVLIETTLGTMVVDLFVKERPNTCKNFLKLCKIKYYNFNQFFTIEQNYIAQSGDPSNSGRGGESIYGILYGDQARYFEKESIPKLKHTRKGLLSMVNNGSNMLGSQFFVTLDDNLDYLDDMHCIFGQVTEGLEVVQKLNEELVDSQNQPYRDIRICHTILLHDPFDDPLRLPIPARSPSPPISMIKNNTKIAVDESVEDEELDTEESRRRLEEKDMRAQAQILEMVGDLHHADERPPDNVLFVCKLNPVTADEDLEIIFSRFGQINCCEVIKDKRTQASLQYAFIEFDKPEYCEAAFLKMDNVLIDDRRIHVDFSQSVAKNFQWNKGGKQAAEPAKKWKTESRSSHPPQSLPNTLAETCQSRDVNRGNKEVDPQCRESKGADPQCLGSKEVDRHYLDERRNAGAHLLPPLLHLKNGTKSASTRAKTHDIAPEADLPPAKRLRNTSAIINFVLIYC